jgi:hypothetical protein
MLTSDDDIVAETGARQACLAAFNLEAAKAFADDALHDHRPALRRGVAKIYAHNLISGPDRARCEAAVVRLFHDEDEEVRRAATGFLDEAEVKDRLLEVKPLVQELLRSPAFREAENRLFRVLEQTPAHAVDLLLAAIERFLTSHNAAEADARTRGAAINSEVSGLLLRVYSQAQDEALRVRCLDLIDTLLAGEAFGMEDALEKLSR